jgi:hypothetical protein
VVNAIPAYPDTLNSGLPIEGAIAVTIVAFVLSCLCGVVWCAFVVGWSRYQADTQREAIIPQGFDAD